MSHSPGGGGDGAAHQLHAEHQHGKAEEYIADVAARDVLAEHAQHYARHGNDGGDGGGGEQRRPAARALDAGKADDPPRDARADERAEDDGDRLSELHHAGVDKSDDHHGRRGGRLDDARHARAEQQPAQRSARQAVEYQLKPAARDLFQSFAHQRHAEEEQRHAAQQRDNV